MGGEFEGRVLLFSEPSFLVPKQELVNEAKFIY
jgi:hypothetical protein